MQYFETRICLPDNDDCFKPLNIWKRQKTQIWYTEPRWSVKSFFNCTGRKLRIWSDFLSGARCMLDIEITLTVCLFDFVLRHMQLLAQFVSE